MKLIKLSEIRFNLWFRNEKNHRNLKRSPKLNICIKRIECKEQIKYLAEAAEEEVLLIS